MFDWHVLNFYHGCLVRWAVPVFVMISGALFLNPDKNIPIKKLYSKYILRITSAFVFWSFLYSCAWYFEKQSGIIGAFKHFLSGNYHLWFLFMISGLYVIVPFVRQIAESHFLTQYFLMLTIIFTFIMPECANLIGLFSQESSILARKLINTIDLRFVSGYAGYFLLGYFLDRTYLSRKTELFIYTAGAAGLIISIITSALGSLYKNEPFVSYGNFTVEVLCLSIAVFVFFKTHFNHENSIVRKLSQYSFGAYLVHAAVIPVLRKIGLHALTFNPVFSVPVIAVIVFMLSFIISAVLNHIPVLKKYIV